MDRIKLQGSDEFALIMSLWPYDFRFTHEQQYVAREAISNLCEHGNGGEIYLRRNSILTIQEDSSKYQDLKHAIHLNGHKRDHISGIGLATIESNGWKIRAKQISGKVFVSFRKGSKQKEVLSLG